MIQIGAREAWLWVAIEPVHSTVLGIYLSRHRNMLVIESFLRSLVKLYGRHTVYSDGGAWYPEAYVFLHLNHRHTSFEKSIIKRANITSKIEHRILTIIIRVGILGVISHVYNWTGLFVFMHNAAIRHIKFSMLARLLEGDQA